MTTDLTYLAYTAILTASFWIPYVVSQVMTNGSDANYLEREPRPVPAWGERANRVYGNAVEVFAPFAALIVVAHLSGKANAKHFGRCASFWMRMTHAVVYWLGMPYVRTVVFTLGFVAIAGIFRELVR